MPEVIQDFGIVFENGGKTTTYWQLKDFFTSRVWTDFDIEERYKYFKETWVPLYKERHETRPGAYHRPVCIVVRKK